MLIALTTKQDSVQLTDLEQKTVNCLNEKFFIINNINNPHTRNKKTDIAVQCIHHRAYFILSKL